MNRSRQFPLTLLLILGLTGGPAHADRLSDIQQRWAEINYDLDGDAQEDAFDALIARAEALTAAEPDNAGAWIWAGICKATQAGIKGGLGALSLAKSARKDLEHAIELDPEALAGSAYTTLGTLYARVPGWPIGFGNDERAEKLLRKALTINPDGIDPNYFLGVFLMDQGRWAEARQALMRAAAAPDRPGRERADRGRREEIAKALEAVDRHAPH